MNYARKLIVVTLLSVFLFSGSVYPENLGKAIANSVVEIVSSSFKQQIPLYVLCAFYYYRFDRWPQNKKELGKVA